MAVHRLVVAEDPVDVADERIEDLELVGRLAGDRHGVVALVVLPPADVAHPAGVVEDDLAAADVESGVLAESEA